MAQIVLASSSPRRIELLHMLFPVFTVTPSNIIENSSSLDPYDVPAELSLLKASDVALNKKAAAVIGADTAVIIGTMILGKPKNREEAFGMLRVLSGKTHSVVTGVTVICDCVVNTFSETTLVTFYDLSDEEINAYIDTDEPYDKAGAYGIQEKAALFVKEIKGDFYNVMGLPVARVGRVIKEQYPWLLY